MSYFVDLLKKKVNEIVEIKHELINEISRYENCALDETEMEIIDQKRISLNDKKRVKQEILSTICQKGYFKVLEGTAISYYVDELYSITNFDFASIVKIFNKYSNREWVYIEAFELKDLNNQNLGLIQVIVPKDILEEVKKLSIGNLLELQYSKKLLFIPDARNCNWGKYNMRQIEQFGLFRLENFFDMEADKVEDTIIATPEFQKSVWEHLENVYYASVKHAIARNRQSKSFTNSSIIKLEQDYKDNLETLEERKIILNQEENKLRKIQHENFTLNDLEDMSKE